MKAFYHTIIKTFVVILLLISFVSFLTPMASASNGAENKNDKLTDRASTGDPSGTVSEAVTSEAKSLNIHYTPFKESLEVEAAATSPQPGAAFREILSANLSKTPMRTTAASSARPEITLNLTAKALPSPLPAPQSKEPLRKIPMSVGEKFNFFFKSSFLSVGAYANAAFSGVRGEAFDKDHDPNGDHGNFFADAGTRAARSFAYGATSKFFERFVYASIFRQDPRYLRSEKKGAGARVGYAVSRVFITEGDKGGSQFNISFLGGGLTASYISKTWEREERKTTGKVLSKWGNHVLITALSNVLREFLAGQ